MTLGNTSGGLPYVLRETITTTGRKVDLKVGPQWICLRVSGFPCKVFFTETDFTNNENYILVSPASTDNPYGEYKSLINGDYIWLKGYPGPSSIELVCSDSGQVDSSDVDGGGYGFSAYPPTSGTFDYSDMGLTTAEVDDIIDTIATEGWTNCTVYLDGDNQSRSPLSDSDIITLLINNVVLFVNEYVFIDTTLVGSFTSVWQGSNARQLTIDPGDGSSSDTITLLGTGTDVSWNHTYSSGGTKQIIITGDVDYTLYSDFSSDSVSTFNLDGMENIEYLDASDNDLTALALIQNLTDLVSLYLQDNTAMAGDIAVLAGLTNLEDLDLSGNTGGLTYTTATWPAWDGNTYDFQDCLLDSYEIGNLLIDFDDDGVNNCTVSLDGTSPAYPNITTVNTAISNLTGNSVTLNLNEYRDMIQNESTALNYWPMDDASSPCVYLEGSTNINITGGTFSVSGQVDGTAVRFNGTSDSGQTDSALDLTSYNKVVIECFLKVLTSKSSIELEFNSNPAIVQTAFSVNVSNGSKHYTYMVGNSGTNDAFFSDLPINTWLHMLYIFDKGATGTEEESIYVNGVKQTYLYKSASGDSTNNFGNHILYLAARAGSSLRANIEVQHLAIYSDLSEEQIEQHAKASGLWVDVAAYKAAVIAETNLLHYWTMDESSSPCADSKGSIGLTISGGLFDVGGKVGNAIRFNGTSDYGQTASTIDLTSTNKVVIECVVKCVSRPVGDRDVFGIDMASITGFDYHIGASADALILRGNVGLNYNVYNISGGVGIGTGSYHHVVCIFDKGLSGSEVALYVDGSLDTPSSSYPLTNNTNNFGDQLFYIASALGASKFSNIEIQQVAIYSDLSAARILAHAQLAGF